SPGRRFQTRSLAASRKRFQWTLLALLVSSRKPTTIGCFSAWLKNSILCGLPSSRMRKSLALRSVTNLPLSSVTVTGTITSVPVAVKFGSCEGAAAGGGVAGGLVAWEKARADERTAQAETAAKR